MFSFITLTVVVPDHSMLMEYRQNRHNYPPCCARMKPMRSDIFNLVLLTGLCCLLLASHPAAAQADAAAAQEHLRAASEAYREGDLEGLTAALETAAELNPFSLYTRYNLACGYARTGRDAEALDILQGLVAARVDFGMADDEERQPRIHPAGGPARATCATGTREYASIRIR
jgi:hypothetical protein